MRINLYANGILRFDTRKSNFFTTPTWVDKRLQSMCSPFPVLYLWSKPAIIAPYVYNPVARSVIATPGLTGSPP